MSILFGAGGPKDVKEIYVGVNGAPRKVKEGYIGVGGAPRRFYTAVKTKVLLPSLIYNHWASVTYGGGKFVAVARSGGSAYSEDGVNWTKSELKGNANWSWVTYGGGKFVVVGSSNNTVAYSADGVSWEEAVMPTETGGNLGEVAYGGGTFVIGASLGGERHGAYSHDGVNWTKMMMPPGTGRWAVTYGDGKFVAVNSDSTYMAGYSPDGATWYPARLPSVGNIASWNGVAYGNGRYVAICARGNTAAYSIDGTTWTQSSGTLPESGGWELFFCKDKFLALGASVDKDSAAYSEDGESWTKISMPSVGTSSHTWSGAAYGSGKFVAVADGTNQAACSKDGINWADEY